MSVSAMSIDRYNFCRTHEVRTVRFECRGMAYFIARHVFRTYLAG